MTREPSEIPRDWDTLTDREQGDSVETFEDNSGSEDQRPPIITLMASSWADLVGMLAVCTAALIAVMILGNRPAIPAFGWAAFLALVWWVFAAWALVLIRQGTPGMLMAGMSFKDPVDPARIGWVLAAALLGVVTIGLPGLLGSDNSILSAAASSELSLDDD